VVIVAVSIIPVLPVVGNLDRNTSTQRLLGVGDTDLRLAQVGRGIFFSKHKERELTVFGVALKYSQADDKPTNPT